MAMQHIPANERQVGGDHYKGAEYQHWDYAHDVKLHGLPWAASKYVSRHRKKNGKQDLEKAVHYYDKAEELGVQGSSVSQRMACFWRFVLENKLTMVEAMICWYIQEGEWEAARLATQELLAETA
jgi:hypothetical protein